MLSIRGETPTPLVSKLGSSEPKKSLEVPALALQGSAKGSVGMPGVLGMLHSHWHLLRAQLSSRHSPCLPPVTLPVGGSPEGNARSSHPRGVSSLCPPSCRDTPKGHLGLERRGSQPLPQSGWGPNGNSHTVGSAPAAWHEQHSPGPGYWPSMAPTCCPGQWQGSCRKFWLHTSGPGPDMFQLRTPLTGKVLLHFTSPLAPLAL